MHWASIFDGFKNLTDGMIRDFQLLVQISGGLCKAYLHMPDQDELSWKRRVERTRTGVDLDAPLSDEEAGEQKELDDKITDCENGICALDME